MNRYATRSPRWFGGTSPVPVLLFRMCCVSTAYRWRMGDAHATHMAYEWRCHCAWCRVHENLTIAYSQCKWRMHSVHPTYARRSTRFYSVWRAYVQRMGCVHAEPINTPHHMLAVNVKFKCSCSWIHMYPNVQFNCPIWYRMCRNDVVLITGIMIC